jgi:hypothetical protein
MPDDRQRSDAVEPRGQQASSHVLPGVIGRISSADTG